MDRAKPDRIRTLLAIWVAYLLVFSWLPLIRVLMDGDSYRWGTVHFGVTFSGAGWSPDLWLPAAKSALLIGLLYGLLRRPGAAVGWALVASCVALAADVIHGFARSPGGLEFHGDTLGIHLNLGWPIVLVTCSFAVLAACWALRQTRRSRPVRRVPWAPANRRTLVLFLGLLPVQFVLLRFGEPHGATDAAGVLLTIVSVPLLARALWPRRSAAAPAP